VQRLLRSRDDIFPDYHLEGLVAALDPVLALEEQVPVPGSQRTLLLFRRR
ncbi:MAG TPA: class I SAM-dependent methyltransferase, partial [Chloroflexi bacterium]|nr:class I SAM-dependent methyltransferase [Chloroflexota bacterium]HHY89921.1 class I SAM-dependent methyltransferase [Chloroflexota bacterium]